MIGPPHHALRPAAVVRWLVLASLLAAGGEVAAQDRAVAPATRPAAAAVASKGQAWNQLAPTQRQALAPLERDWGSLDAAVQAKWLEVVNRLPTLPPEERERIQARMAEWSKLSPAERARARMQFQESRQVTPSDRKAQWDAYQTLPAETRRELALRAKPSAPAKPAQAEADRSHPGTPAAPAARLAAPRPVSPTVVQARPGATTTLLTQQAVPPLHQQAGLPKITATEGFVNPSTLLPKRGPQGAAVRSAAASAPQRSLP